MVVITLTSCPDALRGDLTKWLLEVNVGVFVGRVSARVRDRLWRRVGDHVKEGRATMVFGAMNEQRLDFRVANSEWVPVDFDGLKLMLRPAPKHREASGTCMRPGYSKAAQRQKVRRMAASSRPGAARQRPGRMKSYVVIDLETTGLSPDSDAIIEMSAVRVAGGKAVDRYSALVQYPEALPARITELTGITEEMLRDGGKGLAEVLEGFLSFIGTDMLVAHNLGFDLAFLNAACRRAGIPAIRSHAVDTLTMSKKMVRGIRSHTLKSLSEHFQFESSFGQHRGLADCLTTMMLYEKLINSQ